MLNHKGINMELKIYLSIFLFYSSSIVCMETNPLSLPKNQIFCAAKSRDQQKMSALLKSNKKLANKTDKQLGHILNYTVEHGSLKNVQLLLNYNANVNTPLDRHKIGFTPLHFSTSYPLKTELLLEFQANPNAKSIHGNTPLHACFHYDTPIETIHLLINCGAKINDKNDHGMTCLHFAAVKNPEKMETLLSYKPNINALNHEGQSALHIAVRYFQITIVKLLLENGADAQQKDYKEQSPLDLAWDLSNRYSLDKDEIIQLLERY